MRQAGRYMAEYQAIRAHNSLLEICADPRLAAEVTLQPVRALGVDAAIIFADILLPAVPLGLGLEFVANEGPMIPNPLRSPEAVAALPDIDPVEAFGPTLEAISIAVEELDAKVPLIGFAGAPFTLASYLIEGGPTRRFLHTKELLRSDPETWRQLMEKLAGMTADYLIAQVDAGATALQLFDTWAGVMSAAEYQTAVLPYVQAIFSRLEEIGVPTIYFGVDANHLLPLMATSGANVIGLDWRLPVSEGQRSLGPNVGVQGNLDPTMLLAPPEALRNAVESILADVGGRPGHIFNLGHGILPETSAGAVRDTVQMVREYSRSPAAV